MNYNTKDVSQRLKGARTYLDISVDFMAEKTKTTIEEYTRLENGDEDFSLSFLNAAADALGIELLELLTGETPNLQTYSLVRNGEGLPIERRKDFAYRHIAYLFKDKKIEPLYVTAPYDEKAENAPIHMNTHDGQEMDFVISGKMKFVIGNHTEILNPGDCVYYNSTKPHGMIATGGEPCEFLAVLI